jgi:hypothetical protein
MPLVTHIQTRHEIKLPKEKSRISDTKKSFKVCKTKILLISSVILKELSITVQKYIFVMNYYAVGGINIVKSF